MKSKHRWNRSALFLILSTLVILIGGMLTVTWQLQHRETTRAAAGDVIGPPSLPAATVDKILASLGSPMAGTGQLIEQAASNTNINDTFALGVWWTETNDGAAGVGRADRNPGSVKGSTGYPVAFDGYTIYPSYAAGITDWFNLLKNRYISRGLTSVYTIAHPYVGTSSSPLWAGKVVNLMLRYAGMAPPPLPPTSIPSPIPTPSPIPNPSPTAVPHMPANISLGHKKVVQLAATHSQPKKIQTQKYSLTPQTVNIQSTLSASIQHLVLILSLLIAAGIALAGFKIRHRLVESLVLPVASPLLIDEQPTDPRVPLVLAEVNTSARPLLYVNQYSPVAADRYPELPQPAWPALVPPTPVFSTPARASGAGLLQRYNASSNAEGRPRRVVLQAERRDEISSERDTEGLSPYRSGMSLPGRVAEAVQSPAPGLLGRYRDTPTQK